MTRTKIALGVLNYLPAIYVGLVLGGIVGKAFGFTDLSWWWLLAPVYGPLGLVLTIVWFKALHYYATTTPEERADERLTRAIQARASRDLEVVFGEDVTR